MNSKKENNKIIVKTMESVIESVTKKHKHHKKFHHHHRHHHHHNHIHTHGNRDHHDKNENSELADILVISNAITKNLSIISPNQSIENNENNSQNVTQLTKTEAKITAIKTRKSLHNSSNDECKNPLGNEVINRKSTNSAMKNKKNNAEKYSDDCIRTASLSPTTISKVNAFEIMMNAHNRSIGSNLSGKVEKLDHDNIDDEDDDVNEKSLENASSKRQRKKLLEEWANKKGGLKRKLQEEARENYIEYEMRKRAKRLKSMILNGTNSISKHDEESEKNIETSISDSIKKIRKSKRNKSTKEEIKINTEKIAILSSTPKMEKHIKVEMNEVIHLDSTDEQSDIMNTSKKSVDEEFINKLSSPIKKRDNLLGYFPKIVSPTSFDVEPSKTDSIKNILNSSEDFESKSHKISKKKSNKKNSLTKDHQEDPSSNFDTDNKQLKCTRKLRKSRKFDENIDEKSVKKKANKLELKRSPVPLDEIDVDEISTEIKQPLTSSISSGRPRRSCVSNVRYDYDLDLSPIKKSENKIKTNKLHNSKGVMNENDNYNALKPTKKDKKQDNTSIISVNDHNDKDDILTITDDDDSLLYTEKIPKKLAPIFIKSLPKPCIDAEILLAKQKFLMSGVPEKMKLELEKQKQFELNYEIMSEQFPITEHVYQYEKENSIINNKIDWNDCDIKWKLNENDSDNDDISILAVNKNEMKNKKYKLMKNDDKCIPPLKKLEKIDNKQHIIKHLKTLYDKFPTYRCYNQLREKYRYFSAIDTNLETHQITDSLVVTKILTKNHKSNNNSATKEEQIEMYNDQISSIAPNGELLFTEKYKPLLSEQVLVNFNPVNKLKEFLSLWQIRKYSKYNSTVSGVNTSSYYDFECTNDSTNSSNSNLNNLNNTVVLIGPCSSGKTNAVFAVANELNFNVLEINAGMKRTGKKILQELQEATQSHQVGKDSNHPFDRNGRANKKKKGIVNDNLLPTPEINSNIMMNEKLSLILIEDADIIFEQDNGFIDAIHQLSSISKRPVVITINNRSKNQHLIKLINQNSIEFSSPNILNISKFLSIISLIENCPIDLDDIISLYLYNNKNLRKTLLEMQFFIQSGGDRILTIVNDNDNNKEKLENVHIHRTLFDFYTTNQNYNLRIPLPINLNLLWSNLTDIFHVSENLNLHEKENLKNQLNDSKKDDSKILNILSEFYENISVAANLLSVQEYNKVSEHQHYLSEDISHNLIELSIDINLKADKVPYNLFESYQEKSHLTSYISSNTMTRTNRSINLDYESCLRSICRSEKLRSKSERRSKSRFYHYLRNICITNLSSFSTNLFEKSCEIFSSSSSSLSLNNEENKYKSENP